MSEYNLLWEHPLGDPVMLPCVHMVPQHPGGHGSVPCTHKHLRHPGGHRQGSVTVPCTHIVTDHPNGDPVPCLHMVPQHSEGDPAPAPGGGGLLGPCRHPLPVIRFEPTLHLIFHTSNDDVQTAVLDAVHTLIDTFHINSVGNPLRPLHICARDWAQGVAAGEDNPFWSHYDRDYHAIQIAPPHLTDKQVVLHELGHALVGTQVTQIRRWVYDPHMMKTSFDPGLAMSEGWAHFVARDPECAGCSHPALPGGDRLGDSRSVRSENR